MAIVRWRPYRRLAPLQEEIDNVFNSFYGRRESSEAESATASWSPRVDIHEAKEQFVVEVEIPGVSKEDVKLAVHGNTLTIEGERKYEHEEHDDCGCHRQERFYGNFQRSFTLPTAVDSGKIQATFKDGVLKIDLPKEEAALPREISISVK